jgi:tRNA U34 2-thiouridine synthase MnmA/TrmU
MLKRAGAMAAEQRFDFISTGEVLDQRPMSQNRRSLDIVARESGYPEIVVRPLSAKLLPETRPEKEGLVNRAGLLAISGRNRKQQTRMALEFGLGDYPTPAGGCRLTEPNFCVRLRDLRSHEGLEDARSLLLLRRGRHFRIADRVKLVVGRNEKENALLEAEAEPCDLVLRHEETPGPSGVMPNTAGEDQILLAASICARYGDRAGNQPAKIALRSPASSRTIEVVPISNEEVLRFRIG